MGAGLAAACVPAGQRRRAVVVGAALGTLPDLDVFIDYGDAISNFTMHRGFSHSLFVLLPLSCVLWFVAWRRSETVKATPARWLLAIALSLVTHPLLDAHTAYGTQLFWPLDSPPVAWATLFIIDPAFTLPLLIGIVVVSIRPKRNWTATTLTVCLAMSTVYLAWSWYARFIVNEHVQTVLQARGLAEQPVFLTPTPMNTLAWRVVVMTDNGYLEGFDSLLIDESELRLQHFESDITALAAAQDVPDVARLIWFSDGFVAASVQQQELVITDLRMGQSPYYVFSHVAAANTAGRWQSTSPELLRTELRFRLLGTVWRRIWYE